MKEVYKSERIPENCSTCLYGTGWGCSHADRQKDWMFYGMYGAKCPSYWLNQNKYTPVDGRYW